MEAARPELPDLRLLAQIIQLTALYLATPLYLYAGQFLRDKRFAALFWALVLNWLYILFQTVVPLIYRDPFDLYAAEILGGIIAGLQIIWLHTAAQKVVDNHGGVQKRTPVALYFLCAIVLAANYALVTSDYRTNLGRLAITLVPMTIYWSACLFGIALQLKRRFSNYGLAGRALYGSFGVWAIMQLLFPLRVFPEAQYLVTAVIWLIFFLKLGAAAALLTLMMEEFRRTEASVRSRAVMSELGALAAGFHHDIQSPVGLIAADLDELRKARAADATTIAVITRINERLRQISSSLRFVKILRQEPKKLEEGFVKCSVNSLFSSAYRQFRHTSPSLPLRAVSELKKTQYVRGNQYLLIEAFYNVLRNACEANASTVFLSTRRERADGKTWIDIRLQNNGEPLVTEAIRFGFGAGWSTKKTGEDPANTGMGLFMVRRITEIHGGTVGIHNDEDGGVSVRFRLPEFVEYGAA